MNMIKSQIFRVIPDENVIGLVLSCFNSENAQKLYLTKAYIDYYDIANRLLGIGDKLRVFYYPNKFKYYFNRDVFNFNWTMLILRHFLRLNSITIKRLNGKQSNKYVVIYPIKNGGFKKDIDLNI